MISSYLDIVFELVILAEDKNDIGLYVNKN